jgi:LemA protein
VGTHQRTGPTKKRRAYVVTLVIVIIVVVVLVALVGFGVNGFNKLRKADVQAQEALGGIDVQLTRRADLVPNLVEVVKGYAAHERGVFEEVTAARAGVAKAAASNSVTAKAAAEEHLDRALLNVLAVAEAYPDLKASATFTQLQDQLATTENQVAFARQYYNDAVSKLNTLVSTIPWAFFSGVASVGKREFYRAPDAHIEPPKVDFGVTDPPPVANAPQPPLGTPPTVDELPPPGQDS